MRPAVRDWVEIVARRASGDGPVYEFGAFQVPGQEAIADLRPLFPGREYFGCDMREGPGVDRILDLHGLDLEDGVAGLVISADTLEHVEKPWLAVSEMIRVLRPGGVVAIASVMNFPIHDYPSDYWRFTPEAFRSLLSSCDDRVIAAAGDPGFPHTVVGLGRKGGSWNRGALEEDLAAWSRRWVDPEGDSIREAGTPGRRGGMRSFARSLCPPILLDAYRRFRYGGDAGASAP